MKIKDLNSRKHANFLPHDFKYKDIPPLSLGDEFDPDAVFEEGFDKTGQYFFVFEDHRDKDDDHSKEVKMHVVCFNEKTMYLDSLVWIIHTHVNDGQIYIQKSFFDKDDGVIMHVITWKSPADKDRGPDQLVVDLYYFNVFEILKVNVFGIIKSRHFETRIDDSRRPDITLRYTLEDYNSLEFYFKFNEKTCFMKAFHDIKTGDDQHKYLPTCCFDVVHWNKDGKFWHSEQKEIDLSHSTVFLCNDSDAGWLPRIIHANDRIYFFNTDYSDDGEPKTFHVCQYNKAGDYQFSYEIPWDKNDLDVEFQERNSLILTFYSTFGDLREYNLEDGQVRLIRKIKDGKFDVDKDNGDYDVNRPLRRLDRLLLPVHYEKGADNHLPRVEKFWLIDIEDRKKSEEIIFDTTKSSGHTFSLNWNMEEAAITNLFQKEDGNYEMDFKIFRFDFVENGLSLKHLARLAVLTSYSEEDLVYQQLPTHLFEYLGIEK